MGSNPTPYANSRVPTGSCASTDKAIPAKRPNVAAIDGIEIIAAMGQAERNRGAPCLVACRSDQQRRRFDATVPRCVRLGHVAAVRGRLRRPCRAARLLPQPWMSLTHAGLEATPHPYPDDFRHAVPPPVTASLARTNSARSALVAGTLSMAFSAAPCSALTASSCSARNSIHSTALRLVMKS